MDPLDKAVGEVLNSIEEGSLDDYLDQFQGAIKARRCAVREHAIHERLREVGNGEEYTLSRKTYPVTLRDAVVRLENVDPGTFRATITVISVASKTAVPFIGETIEVPGEYLLDD